MSQPSPSERYDGFEILCPKLGNLLRFEYCRKESHGLPCRRALACWISRFSVIEYMRDTLSPEEWRTCFETPLPEKMASLVDLIEEARKRTAS